MIPSPPWFRLLRDVVAHPANTFHEYASLVLLYQSRTV
jgi:hypothetical protein